MPINNAFRSKLRRALTEFSLLQLEMIAEEARPEAAHALPMVPPDPRRSVRRTEAEQREEVAHLLVQICADERVLDALVEAGKQRSASPVWGELITQLASTNDPPPLRPDNSAPSPGSAPANAIEQITAQRDVFLGSTVDARQVGGTRLGDGAQIASGAILIGGGVGTITLVSQQRDHRPAEFTEDFDRRYLSSLLRYAMLRPALQGEIGPGHSGSGQMMVPHHVQLADAFVPLTFARFAAPDTSSETTPASIMMTGRSGDPPSGNSLGPLLAAYPRLVILGAPGAGKTTLLRHMAVLNAAAWLARAQLPAGWDPEAPLDADYLETRTAEHQALWQQWAVLRAQLWTELGWSTPRYPLLVNMRHLRDVRKWPPQRRLHEAIELDAEALGFAGCPENFFAHRLQAGHTVLLLDAFDELGSPEARTRLASLTGTLLADFYNPAHPVQADNRLLVSARIIGYEDQLTPHGFVTWRVQPLDGRQQTTLVQRYYTAFARAEVRAAGVSGSELSVTTQARTTAWSDDLLARLGLLAPRRGHPLRSSNRRLRVLADNPLLLSLIVALHYSGYELPDDRLRLYQICVERLLQSWQQFKEKEEERPDLEEPPSADPLHYEDKLQLLGGLALQAQIRRSASGDGSVSLPEREVETYIADHLENDFGEGYANKLGIHPPIDSPAREDFWLAQARTWIRRIAAQAGLVRFGGFDPITRTPVLEFAHQTFQEYLAAWYVERTADNHPARQIRQAVQSPAWVEVLLLYLLQARQPNTIRQLVAEILDHLDLNGLIVLGRILGEPDLRPRVDPEQQAEILAQLRRVFQQPESTQTLGDRQAVASVLQQISEQEPRAGQILEAALTDPGDPAVRAGAATALQGLGGESAARTFAVTRLIAVAFDAERADPVLTVRRAAASTVAILGDPRLAQWATDEQGRPIRLIPPSFVPISPPESGSFAPGLTTTELEQIVTQFRPIYRETRLRRLLIAEHNAAGVTVAIAPFAISRYPITNQEYTLYMAEGGRPSHNLPNSKVLPEHANYPVTDLDPLDIWAYTTWLTNRLADGYLYRLPTEAEWEWAARGPQRQLWPWGDQWEVQRCNSQEAAIGQPNPVGLFPTGAVSIAAPAVLDSGAGIPDVVVGPSDMAGNVWELTASTYVVYEPGWVTTPLESPGPNLILRGGSYADNSFYCRTTSRVPIENEALGYKFGFRLVRIPQKGE